MATIITLDEDRESVVSHLEAYIQSGNINFLIGSGASMPAIELAGNVESEINELLEAGNSQEANLRAVQFIEDLEDQHASLSIGIAEEDTTKTLENYVCFLTTIDRLLFERKNILLPRQANVFTTNYDAFIEHAASMIPSLILNDGFDRTSATHTHFPFAPERYFDRTFRSGTIYERQAEVPTINLVKMHGSLTWKNSAAGIHFRNEAYANLTKEQKVDPSAVVAAIKSRALILPNLKKFESTIMDRIYYDLLRIYANSLDRENSLLITFGFSFADEHILDITRRALRNPTSQLVVLAYDSHAANGFEEKFTHQRNVLVISPEKGENIDFSILNKLLESLAPMEA